PRRSGQRPGTALASITRLEPLQPLCEVGNLLGKLPDLLRACAAACGSISGSATGIILCKRFDRSDYALQISDLLLQTVKACGKGSVTVTGRPRSRHLRCRRNGSDAEGYHGCSKVSHQGHPISIALPPSRAAKPSCQPLYFRAQRPWPI